MVHNSDKKSFSDIVQGLSKKKYTFIVEEKGDNQIIFLNHRVVGRTKKTSSLPKDKFLKTEALLLFSTVKRSITKQIIKLGLNVPTVECDCTSTWRNNKLYYSLKPKDKFFYVDVSHCYWRIAFLQGWISEKLYKSVLGKEHLKQFRNMSLSCIVTPKVRKYYINGDVENRIFVEDKNLYQRVYNNIRFTSYNLCDTVRKKVGDDNLLFYKTDGFLVMEEALAEVHEIIFENNFECKINECYKIDNKYFKYVSGKLKQF